MSFSMRVGKQTDCIDLRGAHRIRLAWPHGRRGIGAGQRYGYRVDGPWEPERMVSASIKAKLLVDPYAEGDLWDRSTGRQPIFALPRRVEDNNDLVRKTTVIRRLRHSQVGRHRPQISIGAKDCAPADAALRLGHLRGARQGLLEAQPRGSGRGFAAPTQGSPIRRASIT